MIYEIKRSKGFKKAIKKIRDKETLNKIAYVIDTLASGEPLAARYQDHALQGEWLGYRECHIKPDLLLVYKIDKNLLILTCVNLGSHSKAFK